MALTGKLIMYVDITSHGDIFHEMFRHRVHDLASISPDHFHGCEIDGQPGAVGSIIFFNYTRDGKKLTAKSMLEEVDEKNHKVVFNVIEGDLVEELYKSLKVIFHVEPKGDGQLAIWTLEFEKMNTNMPYPTSYMDFLLNVTTDLDSHCTSH
ncbi:kirola-like [Cynara cardunculus var. scolymus]|uniref:Bet v I domain-containing protein n=1 Tax=Cynara cardunculus var. scolymus TaxID=59895 RepID=A0A103XVH5_CYNCS|nr:kirola-like [Cynara cardunculus var. scolymus]KVH97649.1 Bet v I domain-containing protein [Cynara cardunculus var. scolymus]